MRPIGIIWAGLQVADLEKQVFFYQEVIGLRLIRKNASWAVFDAGGVALFELTAGGEGSDLPKTSRQQSLVAGFRVANLTEDVQLLREKGVSFLSEIESYKSSRWVKFADPEGNILELKEVA
jgi:predicted enzyme related to lactoylglutathione lyase